MSRFVQHPAYQAGLRARREGYSQGNNPFPVGTVEHHRWSNAWKNENKRQVALGN